MEVSTNITCLKCNSVGVAVWERMGTESTLISLTRNFYERISKQDPFPVEVVCVECGTVQITPVQP